MQQNHFAYLGLEPDFDLDAAALKAAYFAVQQKHHPDKATQDAQRMEFLHKSADANAAYQLLKDPLQRLYYMLKLQGHDVLKEGAAPPSPALLMEVMEWREAAADCVDKNAKAQLKSEILAHQNIAISAVRDAYHAQNWDAAVEAAGRVRYLSKIIEELR